MKSWFKIISGLLITLVVIGVVTMLAIKYFGVIVRGFEALRDKVTGRKARFFGSECCDYEEDDDLAEAEEL